MSPRGSLSLFTFACLASAALATFACGDEAASPSVSVRMDFGSTDGFYASPFPTDQRRNPDGTVNVTRFPRLGFPTVIDGVVDMVDGKTSGFGTTSGIFFELTGSISDSDLPDVVSSVDGASPVVLLGVDEAAPDRLTRYPISSRFLANAGPYGGKNLLALVPLQGAPLRPSTLYAAVVMTSLRDSRGKPLAISDGMRDLAEAKRPPGMSDAAFSSYSEAIAVLPEAGIEPTDVAGLAVFTTGAPTEDLSTVVDTMLAAPPIPSSPFVRNEMFDDYCVYETTLPMPEYQGGQPPYTDAGGAWVFDASGQPVLQREEEANFVVTIPRTAMPTAGYPIVVLSRTGAGGERPLVDRGVHATPHGPSIEPGTGPAHYFAGAGFAGSSIDGPHGGLRNVTHGDEQFLMFNVGNPPALRDNVRQSAAELVLQAHVLESVTIEVSDCPGAIAPGGIAHFDTSNMALMGHSMGATIAPLSLAYEPRFRAGLLSGAGGSWIENVIYKLDPVAVKGIAEILVGVSGTGYELSEWDPALNLFQWALEGADPPVYASRIVREPEDGPPRNILMMQGIVDHYILPPIANATSLSLGLDLAGDELDHDKEGLEGMTPLGDLLSLRQRSRIDLPAGGNVTSLDGTQVTAVVTQHPADGIEDGHEVMFQTEAPKHEYRCFLESLLVGVPRVPSGGGAFDLCTR